METNLAISIAKYRAQQGLTPGQLAERLHISETLVSQWEGNYEAPDPAMLPALADALGVSMDTLLRTPVQPSATLRQATRTAEPGPADTHTPASYAEGYTVHPWATPTHILTLVASILGFAGILTSFIVDLAINRTLSWSILAISSILYAYLSCIPLMFFKRRRVGISLLVASVLLFPFLYILSRHTGGWFYTLGLPCAIAGLLFAWAMLLVWGGKLGVWTKLSLTALVVATTDIGIDAVLYSSGVAPSFPSTGEYFSVIGLAAAAVVLFIIGRVRRAT